MHSYERALGLVESSVVDSVVVVVLLLERESLAWSRMAYDYNQEDHGGRVASIRMVWGIDAVLVFQPRSHAA